MKKTLFIGAGNMGAAILTAGIKSGVLNPKTTYVSDPAEEKVKQLQNELGVQSGRPADAEVVILAVKPQIIEKVFPIQSAENAVFVSIMAGVASGRIAELAGTENVCRVMPNTPAMVFAGASALFFSDKVDDTQKQFCRGLFGACGKVVELQDEEQMHAVTALSGSGPAYFFRFTEELAVAAKKLGLPPELAASLAQQTFIGSAELLKQSSDSPAELRQKVTSPGGTTQAALEAFDEAGLGEVVQKATVAAEQRSRELG
jgi:pyrroline-5-carboxylate reductase